MHLWNDYEGTTLAGAFPLDRLLRTEGRSASFSARDSRGHPAVVRLTEALNDEDQLRARYSNIQGLHSPFLVKIEDFGETAIDGTPLIYLVLEATQESLAEIVQERRLSIDETNEVATSVVSAVEALHSAGLVHGQIDTESILAAGEVIKLRSDCIHLAPEGTDGAHARTADVLGVADVLHRALTQQPLFDASDALALPEPYATIIRYSVRGSWTIQQVAAELRKFVRPPAPPTPLPTDTPSFAATLAAAARVADLAAAAAKPAVIYEEQPQPLSSRSGVDPVYGATKPAQASGPAPAHAAGQLPLLYAASLDAEPEESAATRQQPAPLPPPATAWEQPPSTPQSNNLVLWVLALAAILVLLLAIWYFARPTRAAAHSAVAPSSPAAIAATPQPVQPSPPIAAPEPSPSIPPTLHIPAPVSHGEVWRVVAYTYNSRGAAEVKAHWIDKRHSNLHAEVYSPSGRAPYLVTLGGPLTRGGAAALRQHARTEGLARDVYIQNYSH